MWISLNNVKWNQCLVPWITMDMLTHFKCHVLSWSLVTCQSRFLGTPKGFVHCHPDLSTSPNPRVFFKLRSIIPRRLCDFIACEDITTCCLLHFKKNWFQINLPSFPFWVSNYPTTPPKTNIIPWKMPVGRLSSFLKCSLFWWHLNFQGGKFNYFSWWFGALSPEMRPKLTIFEGPRPFRLAGEAFRFRTLPMREHNESPKELAS